MSLSKIAINVKDAFKVDYDMLANDLAYDRDHPFYDNWKDWQALVYEYHSPVVAEAARVIYGVGVMSIDSLYGAMQLLRSEYLHVFYEFKEFLKVYDEDMINNEFEYKDSVYIDALENIKWMDTTFRCKCAKHLTPSWDCPFADKHYKGLYLATIWHYYKHCSHRFSNTNKFKYRRYYCQLTRVIMAMNLKRLKKFNYDWIRRPDIYSTKGSSLLRSIYTRGFLDEGITAANMALKFEQYKHFIVKEQGGIVNQCVNDSTFFPERFYSLCDQVLGPMTYEQVMGIPVQQSLFGVDHLHTIDKSGLADIKKMIIDTQDNFLKGFKDNLLSSTKSLMIMFATASTVSLISKHTVGMSFDLIRKILHLIYSLIFPQSNSIQNFKVAVEQSGDDISIPFIPAMILQYVIQPGHEVMERLWKNPNIDTVMRRLGYLGDARVERGIERIVEWMRSTFDNVYRWFCSEILGTPRPEDLQGPAHVIQEWNEEVDGIIKQYYDNRLGWSETTWSILYNLYSRGLTFIRTPAYNKWKNDVWKIVTQIGNLLQQFKMHQRDGQSIRNPPVTIYVSGGTGVGKSSVTYPLAAEILRSIFMTEESPVDLKKYWKSLIYMRSAEQEFWDGYENQLVTVFDDFNQQADSAANPSLELFEIIRAANCFPYPLHMASLDQKATTTFTSKIIIVSSNMDKPKTQSLNFPDALYRRFDISVRVRRAPDSLDYVGDFDPNIFIFEMYNMQTGKFLQTVNYKELIALAVDKYFNRKNFVDSVDNYIDGLFDEPSTDTGEAIQNFREQQRINRLRFGLASVSPVFNTETLSEVGSSILDDVPVEQGGVVDVLRSFYTKYKLPFLPDLSTYRRDAWVALNVAVSSLKCKYHELKAWYINFQEEHPYLVKSFKIASYVILGLGFIKVFCSFQPMTKKPLITEEGFMGRNASISRTGVAYPKNREESYTPVQVKAKVESYTPVVAKAKVEGYSPVVLKAKVEGDVQSSLVEEQGVKDLNAAEIMLSITKRNLYKMYETTTGAAIGHVFFIRGQICLMPKHFLKGMQQSMRNDPDARVFFQSALLNRAFEVKISEMLETRLDFESPDEDISAPFSRDLMTVVVKSSIIHADSLPYFASRDILARVDATSVMLPIMVNNTYGKSNASIVMLRFREGKSAITTVQSLPVAGKDDRITRRIRSAWRYEADTMPTECGTTVIVRNNQIKPGKICGIHIAGIQGTGEGFATPLYHDDVVRILASRGEDALISRKYEVKLSEIPKDQGQIPTQADFIRLGLLDVKIAQPTKTKIRPSLCYNKIKEPVTKPCQLRDSEEFSPRGYRLERLGNVPSAFPRDIAEISRKAFVDSISEELQRAVNRKSDNIKSYYSFDEAVCGIDGELYVTSIKRKTSPGFPYVTDKEMKTRWKIFGEQDDFDLTTDQAIQLRERCKYIEDQARVGVALDHVFCDTLKDERKPIHKAHKTRLFSAGPVDYLIVCKQYFNGAVALLQMARNSDHVSVGVNPYAYDWGQIVNVLHQKSTNIVAGDFEGFDASQHRVLLEQAGEVFVEISARFLGATLEQQRIMRVLLVSLLDSVHVTSDEVYQWTHSLPSGHYLTAPINSVFVNLAFGCVWMENKQSFTYMTGRKFWEKCGIVAYGDDHLVSIPDDEIQTFNQLTMPLLFRKYGLSYTLEDKDAVATLPFRRIEEVLYLKRSFLRDETGFWLSPLSLDVILETPMWLHECPDRRLQTIENLEWSLKELSLHSQEVWNKWSPVLHRNLEELSYYTLLKDQKETRLVCLAQTLEM